MRYAIFGGGSWGTALAHHLARVGCEVLLWAREPEVVEGINSDRRNPLFLADLELHPQMRASSDLEEVAKSARAWLWVVPVQHSREVMRGLTGAVRSDVTLISASKGVETDTLMRMDQLAWETLNLPGSRFCCLSGATFAKEVILGYPSAAVLACSDMWLAQQLQTELSDRHLRVYASSDLVGVELAGALKNVIAIAAGMVDGLGFGANTRAALMTRGLHEITRLGVRMGADSNTFRGLAGMGDLVLTCTSDQSRNRTVGHRLGVGEKLETILGSMREVAEGVRTAPAAARLAAQVNVEMPITEAVVRILNGDVDPRTATIELMQRELKEEARL